MAEISKRKFCKGLSADVSVRTQEHFKPIPLYSVYVMCILYMLLPDSLFLTISILRFFSKAGFLCVV